MNIHLLVGSRPGTTFTLSLLFITLRSSTIVFLRPKNQRPDQQGQLWKHHNFSTEQYCGRKVCQPILLCPAHEHIRIQLTLDSATSSSEKMSISALPPGIFWEGDRLPPRRTHVPPTSHYWLNTRIFSDLNYNNFPSNTTADPVAHHLTEIPSGNGIRIRPGLFCHIGTISPQTHKATLEKKYGFATEYVDELQMKWISLKGEAAGEKPMYRKNFEEKSIATSASTPSLERFDPFLPHQKVWDKHYFDSRDGVMAEIFTKVLTDKTTLVFFMDTVHTFWKASRQDPRPSDFRDEVAKTLILVVDNEQVAREKYLYDYLELLWEGTPPPEPVLNKSLTPEERQSFKDLEKLVGGQLQYVQAFLYVCELFTQWLRLICKMDKPSPSSNRMHLHVAQAYMDTVLVPPKFTPANTFIERFEAYCNVVAAFADWMRIKFSREDYMLRVKHAHQLLKAPEDDDQGDEYLQVLFKIWVKLGQEPETGMMHFSWSEVILRMAFPVLPPGAPPRGPFVAQVDLLWKLLQKSEAKQQSGVDQQQSANQQSVNQQSVNQPPGANQHAVTQQSLPQNSAAQQSAFAQTPVDNQQSVVSDQASVDPAVIKQFAENWLKDALPRNDFRWRDDVFRKPDAGTTDPRPRDHNRPLVPRLPHLVEKGVRIGVDQQSNPFQRPAIDQRFIPVQITQPIVKERDDDDLIQPTKVYQQTPFYLQSHVDDFDMENIDPQLRDDGWKQPAAGTANLRQRDRNRGSVPVAQPQGHEAAHGKRKR